MNVIVAALMIAIGLFTCFFGKQMIKWILGLQALIAVFYPTFTFMLRNGQSELIAFVIAAIAGIIVGYIAYKYLYKWVFVILGVIVGLVVAGLIVTAFALGDTIGLVLLIIGGIIGAILGWRLSALLVMIATSISGAAQTIGGIAILSVAMGLGLPLVDPLTQTAMNTTSGVISIVATIILAAIGFMYQRSGGIRL